MPGWAGYEKALARDPEGVKAVLRVAKDIPHVEGREAMSPTLEHELAWIVERESTWRPDIVNSIGATGLIQFMPETARQLGTSQKELQGMTLKQQSKYVAKYFDMVTNAVGPAKKPGDLYMMTFYPKAMHTPDDYIIGAQDSAGKWERSIWEQNPGLRCTPMGPITTGCVRAWGTPKSEPPSGFPSLHEPGPVITKTDGGFGGLMLVMFLVWAGRKYLP